MNSQQAGQPRIIKHLASTGRVLVKQLLFVLIICILFFGTVEILLALFGVKPILLTEDPLMGFADNVPLYVEEMRADGSVGMRTAENKLHLFNGMRFPKIKPAGSYRIFCVGGSTTFGRPYRHKSSFCGWLEAFLMAAAPDRHWEVINAGGVSYASYRVAHLMQELVRYQPDLFIVYSGQNEFLEERSYGKLLELPNWMTQMDSVLNGTRTYSTMKHLIGNLKSDSMDQARARYQMTGEVDEVLAHSAGPTSYHRDDKKKQKILTHYRLNLERMVALAHGAEADVIFVKPVVNLKDMSPFKSEHKHGLSDESLKHWDDLFYKAQDFHKAGKLNESLALYQQALMIDDRYAELYFRMGQVRFALGEHDEAEVLFWRAVDEDVAPLRMVSAMPPIVAEVASKNAVPVVDFEQILRQTYLQEYKHSVFGNEYFIDNVHPNIKGYRLLGLGLFELLAEQGIVTPDMTWGGEKIAAVTDQVNASIDKDDHAEALFQLAKLFDWAGKFEEAKNLLIKHLELYGQQGFVYAQLGKTAKRQNNFNESIYYLRQAQTAGFNELWVYEWLGDMLKMQKQYQQSANEYLQILKVDSKNYVIHDKAATVLALLNDTQAAHYHLNEALRIQPEYESAVLNMMLLLAKEQQYEKALNQGRALLKKNPDHYRAYNAMGIIMAQQGQLEQAIEYFSEAMRINPDFALARQNMQRAKDMLAKDDTDNQSR